MPYKTRNFILPLLKSPIFLFSNHVTPEIRSNASIRGNGPGGPEFAEFIKVKECFEPLGSASAPTVGSVSAPTEGFEYRISNKEFRTEEVFEGNKTIFFTSIFCGSLFCGSAVQNKAAGSRRVGTGETEKLKDVPPFLGRPPILFLGREELCKKHRQDT